MESETCKRNTDVQQKNATGELARTERTERRGQTDTLMELKCCVRDERPRETLPPDTSRPGRFLCSCTAHVPCVVRPMPLSASVLFFSDKH